MRRIDIPNGIIRNILIAILTITFRSNSYSDTLTYSFSADDFVITQNGNTTVIKAKDPIAYYGNPDQPCLPSFNRQFLCPYGQDISSWSLSSEKILIATDVQLLKNSYPIPASATEYSTSQDNIDICTASYDTPVTINPGIQGMKGMGFKSVSICPFQYDVETRNLYLYTTISISLDWTNSSKWRIVPTATVKENVNTFFQQEELSTLKLSSYPVQTITSNKRIDYLIVTVDSLKPTMQELLEWRRCLGMKAEMVSVEDICREIPTNMDTQLKIKTYLSRLYQFNALQYVTLVGTVDQVPTRYCYAEVKSNGGSIYKKNIPADVYYAAFDNDLSWNANNNNIYGENNDNIDLIADIAISRIPCGTTSELKGIIQKTIRYERCFDNYKGDTQVLFFGHKMFSYWGAKSDAHGMSEQIIDLYNDCGIHSDLLFDTGSSISGTDFSLSSVQSVLSSNYMWSFELSHGAYDYWEFGKYSDPGSWNYFYLHANQLNNNHSFILSTLACNTAAFDEYPSLGSSFLSNKKGGCINYIGSCREGWLSPSETTHPTYAQLEMGNMLRDFLKSSKPIHLIGDVFNTVKTIYGPAYSQYTHSAFRWLYYSHTLLGDVATRCFNRTPIMSDINFGWSEGNKVKYTIQNFDSITNPEIVITYNPSSESYSQSNIIPTQESVISSSSNSYILCIKGDNSLPILKSVNVIDNLTIDNEISFHADMVSLDNVEIKSSGKLEIQSSSIRINPSVKTSIGSTFKITVK